MEKSRELQLIESVIEDRAAKLLEANACIHDFAELSYEEVQSAAVLTKILREEGFTVEEGLAKMPTCFTGTWGTGNPVVGFLGEFDALDKLSQESGNPVRSPLQEGAPGHGCGHCCLGTGALGAAIALKEYLSAQGLSGTVIYYGCPAEEGAGAKQFMARAGLFDCCDFVYTWHPSAFNEISPDSSTAIMGANFEFRGVTAHAGGSPWAGRSALDAAELMNVGCNYLREHIRDGERVHYAYGDAGGTAPNVVPDYARIKYEVRSPKVAQVKELFERVVHVAEGAARMTDTQMTCEMTMAFSDSQNNTVLGRIADRALHEVGAPEWTQEDYDLARRFTESYDENSKESVREELRERFGDAALPELLNKPLCSVVLPYNPSAGRAKGGSTDVGDVTYTVPTCEVHVATYAMGTVGHTWQLAGQAGSPIGEKGLLAAAKVMALAAVYTMQDPAAMQAAKEETLRRNGGKYVCPLPDSVDPPVGKY